MKATILGTGSWGTSFGRHLAHKWDRVVLWGIVPEQVDAINKTGTNPAYLATMYMAVSRMPLGPVAHVDYLVRFQRLIRAGAPPDALADAIERLIKKNDLPRDFDRDYLKVANMYAEGTPFDEAVKSVLPKPKAPR